MTPVYCEGGKTGGIILEGVVKEYVPPLSLSAILRLRFKRNPIPAVRGVDLNVAPGTVHALVGPNGAGKTTILKLVAALLQPTRGRVNVLGMDTVLEAEKVRAVVGYCITETRSFYLRLSGRENLRFFAALHGLTGKEMERRTDQVLSLLELSDVARRQVLSYSEGMKQRLALARAILHEPRVLLLDEVGRGLDPRLREKTYRILRDELVAKKGMTVLMASHNLDEVAALADRVSVMDHGLVLRTGTYSETGDAIRGVFGGE